MKKILALILLAAMALSLVACGNNGSTNNGGSIEGVKGNFAVPAEGYDGSEVTIKFAHTMGAKLQAVLDYHIGEFNKLYPNIHIEHSSYGGWGDIAGLINTEIMGDNQPNIAYCYPDHVANYNTAWATVTLDELIESELVVTRDDGTTEVLGLTAEEIADLQAGGFYEEGTVYGDGLMYTMPLSKSTEVLYYNKTFFEENGLTVPTTWEEMEATCKKILEIDPKAIPLGYDSEDNMFITMCEQNGYDYTSATGEHFLFNNDDCKSFVKMFREWYQAGYITTEALYGSYTSGLFTELDKEISHSYMCVGSSGGASYQIPDNKAFEVGIASIPQVDPANPKVISQGPSLCILKGGKTSDQQVVASWLFVKYLVTNMGFQTEFSSTSGYMPVIASAQENEVYKNWLDKADGYSQLTALVIKTALQNTSAYFTSPAFVGSSTARTEVGELLAACMANETTDVDNMINKAFEEAYNECKYHAG